MFATIIVSNTNCSRVDMVHDQLDGAAQHRDPVLRVADRPEKVPVGSRIVPKPSRATDRSPPIAKVPEAAAGRWCSLCSSCPQPGTRGRGEELADWAGGR
jgi:hypothetical protein